MLIAVGDESQYQRLIADQVQGIEALIRTGSRRQEVQDKTRSAVELAASAGPEAIESLVHSVLLSRLTLNLVAEYIILVMALRYVYVRLDSSVGVLEALPVTPVSCSHV